MWLAKQKLEILYRSSFDVEKITNRISKIVSKRTDLPFSIQSLNNLHDLLKKRLEILLIFKKYPESYDSVLNGTELPKEMNEELHVYLKGNENGIKEYNFLRGIRKRSSHLQRFENLDEYYNKTLENFKSFKRDYEFILENLETYNNILKEKKSRKLRQERHKRRSLQSSDKEGEIEDLQRTLEEMDIQV
tara:strand:- start:385 stop:954 length:570 start_codon:yes stop_codon:yes gene_type:complete